MTMMACISGSSISGSAGEGSEDFLAQGAQGSSDRSYARCAFISEIWERMRRVLVSPGQVSQFTSHTSFREWDKFKISREETDMAASGCCFLSLYYIPENGAGCSRFAANGTIFSFCVSPGVFTGKEQNNCEKKVYKIVYKVPQKSIILAIWNILG